MSDKIFGDYLENIIKKQIEKDINNLLNETFEEIETSEKGTSACDCTITTEDIKNMISELSGQKFLKEICITDKLEKDFLIAEEYLILTKKTYELLKASNSDILKDVEVFESDERYKKYFKAFDTFTPIINKKIF